MGFFEWVGNALFGTLTAKMQHLTTKNAKLAMTSTTDPNVPFRQDVADFEKYYRDGAEKVKETEIDQELATHSPITPEEALLMYPTVSLGAFAIHTALDIGQTIVEVASLGQVDKTIPSFKDTLTKFTAADFILQNVTKLPIEIGLQIPYKFYWQGLFRSIIPPMGDIVEARSRYLIDDTTFKETAKYHGYTDERLKWYSEFANTPLRYFALAAIARGGLYDEAFYEEELKRAGYARGSIDKLKDMYIALAGESELAGAKSIASKAYREGIIDRSKFEELLLLSGLDPSLIGLTISVEDLRLETEKRDLGTSVHAKLFTQGIISEGEFRNRLADLGYTSSGIDDLVAIYIIKKQEDPKQLSLGQLNDGIKYGLITEKYYYDKTKDLGYSMEYATLLLDTLKAKQTKTPQEDHRDLSLSQVVKMFKQELLTLEQLEERLSLMGYNETDRNFLVASAVRDLTVPESDVWKPLPRSVVMDLYMNGVIDYDEYVSRMELLRYKNEDADLLIVLEFTKEGAS